MVARSQRLQTLDRFLIGSPAARFYNIYNIDLNRSKYGGKKMWRDTIYNLWIGVCYSISEISINKVKYERQRRCIDRNAICVV